MADRIREYAPRSLKPIRQWLQEHLKIKIGMTQLRLAVKALGFRYKRMRQSMKHKRDEVLFDFFKEELALLHQMEQEGEIDVYYFDETGINLSPVVPYGWQPVGETHRLSCLPSQNHTVVGFMNKQCDFYGFRFEGAATAASTVACMDDFAKQLKRKTVIILDNASIHKADYVLQNRKKWEEQGLFLQFIPAYCPELNLIERLWLEFKYRWIDKPAYFSDGAELINAIEEVVKGIGAKYTVNFR